LESTNILSKDSEDSLIPADALGNEALPMLLSRDELVSALFCETDRAQRLKMPLAMIAVGVAKWEAPESTLEKLSHDIAERGLVERITGILRCYDSVGKWADGEFLLLLPGCTVNHARTLAERLRDEVFATPVEPGREKALVLACFGVASSGGRSPFVVLREVESALQQARAAGPGAIKCSTTDIDTDPTTFLIPIVPSDLHW
jgi:GGDEF domain-containing protein